MKWKVEYSKEAKKFINDQNIWSEVRSGIRKFLQKGKRTLSYEPSANLLSAMSY